MTNRMRRNVDMNIKRANGETMSLKTDENIVEAIKVERKNSGVMVLKWTPAWCALDRKSVV